MQVGDLVKNRSGDMGTITKRYIGLGSTKHWWVHWISGSYCTIHERFLEVVSCK